MTRKTPPPKSRLRGTGTVRFRGDKFEARWRVDGKEHARRFDDAAAASDFLDEQMVDQRKAKSAGTRYRSPNDNGPTFGEMAEAFLRDREALGLTPKTLISIRSVIDNYLNPRFETKKVGAITVGDIEQMLGELATQGLAPTTRIKALRTLGPIMRRARRLGYIASNPVLDLERSRLKGGRPKPVMIGFAQVELLASVIEPYYAPLITFAAFTGCRAGELAELRWRDLDFAGGWVNVERSVAEISIAEAKRSGLPSVTPGFHIGPPKNGHARRTVLLPSVAELLGEPGAPEDLVFRMERGGRIRWDNLRKRVWAPAVNAAVKKSAEIEGAPPFPPTLRIHDLRHAFVSIAYNEVGLNPRQIAEMSGHRDMATMLNVYLHVFGGWDEKLAERFETARKTARLTLVAGTKSEPRKRGAA